MHLVRVGPSCGSQPWSEPDADPLLIVTPGTGLARLAPPGHAELRKDTNGELAISNHDRAVLDSSAKLQLDNWSSQRGHWESQAQTQRGRACVVFLAALRADWTAGQRLRPRAATKRRTSCWASRWYRELVITTCAPLRVPTPADCFPSGLCVPTAVSNPRN